MSTLIESFPLTHLHQEEDLGFHGMAYARLSLITDQLIQYRIQDYRNAIDTFDVAIKQDRASLLTENIKVLDYQVGNTYHGFRDAVHRLLRDINKNKSDAARKIDFVLKKYEINGDPTALALVEQLEVFANLIDALKAPSVADALETLQIKYLANELEADNTQLLQLYEQRTDDTSTFVTGLSKQWRKTTDDHYTVITGYINGLISISGDTQFETVVQELNRLIDELKVVLATRKTINETHKGHNLSLADVSDISVQIYTGEKITPTFEVFIHGERLSNVTDYAAEYKNNVNVGTASVIISGKGKYTGKKTVTFNIARTV